MKLPTLKKPKPEPAVPVTPWQPIDTAPARMVQVWGTAHPGAPWAIHQVHGSAHGLHEATHWAEPLAPPE